MQNDNGWKSTHTLLVKLVRLAIETGTVTGMSDTSQAGPWHLCDQLHPLSSAVVVSIIYLVLVYANGVHVVYDTFPSSSFFAPLCVLGKVYSNAMMANFNHRIQIQDDQNDPHIMSSIMCS